MAFRTIYSFGSRYFFLTDLKWFESTLPFSRICSVTSGIPQGSCLGPLLFNLLINDITDHLPSSVKAKLFADALKIYTELSHCNQNLLQLQLDLIQHWSQIWQMTISHSKCNILTIGHSRDHAQSILH